jgi:hypothetical protein
MPGVVVAGVVATARSKDACSTQRLLTGVQEPALRDIGMKEKN